MHFGFYADEIECETGKEDFSNKVIILNATSGLIFQYKNTRKTILYNWSISIGLQRQICEGNR